MENEINGENGTSVESGLDDLLKALPLFQTMDDAIDAAACHLPEGYKIILSVERHGYGVSLMAPDGDDQDVDGGDGMRSDFHAGIMQSNGL